MIVQNIIQIERRGSQLADWLRALEICLPNSIYNVVVSYKLGNLLPDSGIGLVESLKITGFTRCAVDDV